MKIKITKECNTEDYKTMIANKYEPIPKGTIIENATYFGNFLGLFYECRYNGKLYYLDLDNCEVIK